MKRLLFSAIPALAAVIGSSLSFAHEGDYEHRHVDETEVKALSQVTEETGPVNSPPPMEEPRQVSGQGFWQFAAVPEALPIPQPAVAHVVGAHGTIVVDPEEDAVYWGLANIGWIVYRKGLSEGEIISGDPVFASGNLHGGDLYLRSDDAPLIAVADNVRGEVYLSDTSFEKAELLDWPQGGPYGRKGEFHPTDVAFTDDGNLFVTDGYGKAFFRRATTDPLQYDGPFIGGKELSHTPHGITYRKEDNSLRISARPEGQVKGMTLQDEEWLETFGLPPGSTVCDIDIWGDYALAPCLNGPDGSPGPIYILNLKNESIASVIKPKEELGFDQAQHIHDAAWYFSGEGDDREVYIVFTNWNPGGIGALKLVNAAGAEASN